MSELNSSLCQLNWLIAKGGIGAEPIKEPVEENCAPVQEGQLVQSQPLQITIPTPKQVPHPQKSHDKKRRKVFDGPDKPPYSYSQLIRFAIEETEEKKCTLSEIYAYIAHNFQFYRENRNTSWKNSIRHNLSLNKQFSRIERTDGDRRGWWVCVDPPEKKPRVLKGSPVRVNPIYEEFYRKTKREEEEEEVVLLEQSTMYGETYITELTGDIRELTDQEIRDLDLFESYDLNSSFRDVYNQIFEKEPEQNNEKKAAQIDWLKISLEAAGVDYQDEMEMAEVDTIKLREYVQNGIPLDYDSSVSTASRHSSSDSNVSSVPQLPQNDVESDDEFDWNKLL